MIAYPCMLVEPARRANMAVPPDVSTMQMVENQKADYPHFAVYCALQLGYALPYPSAHWNNAQVIASIPIAKLQVMNIFDFVMAGFDLVFD